MKDDRRHCRECVNLYFPSVNSRHGVCSAASSLGAATGYRPVDDIPRRCSAFREVSPPVVVGEGGLQR